MKNDLALAVASGSESLLEQGGVLERIARRDVDRETSRFEEFHKLREIRLVRTRKDRRVDVAGANPRPAKLRTGGKNATTGAVHDSGYDFRHKFTSPLRELRSLENRLLADSSRILMIASGCGADHDLQRLRHEPPHLRSFLGFSLDGRPEIDRRGRLLYGPVQRQS